MSDDPEDSEMQDSGEIDPGEPIAALAGFEHDTTNDLVVRSRHTIQLRTTVGQLTSFSVSTPLVVLRELWLILGNQLDPVGTRKDASHGGKTS
jgi:hypothetical protein